MNCTVCLKFNCKEKHTKNKNIEKFILKARKFHGLKYDYSKIIEYKNREEIITIICPKERHGEFKQKGRYHLYNRTEHHCPECKNEKQIRDNTENFILKAQEIHESKYDYSNVVILKNREEIITIICPKERHGEFEQIASNHLDKRTEHHCPECKKENDTKIASEKNKFIFLEKAKKKHGDKYNYSKVNYINAKVPVIIICPMHGEFLQTPDSHIHCNGCSKCSGVYKYTTEEWIKNMIEKYKDKYDYSKVIYKSATEKVPIICPIHGEFLQTPNNHRTGYGCKSCGIERTIQSLTYTREEFIQKSKEVHGDKYDYSKVSNFKNLQEIIIIICTDQNHGEFLQRANLHMNGSGCKKCARIYTPTIQEWIDDCKKIHKDKYKYDENLVFENLSDYIELYCNIHKKYFLILAGEHRRGKECQLCGIKKGAESRKLTLEQFIQKSKNIFGNVYDYTGTVYIKNIEKLKIRCKIHNCIFEIDPHHHISQEIGCPECSGKITKHTMETFMKKILIVHGNKYDYSKVNLNENKIEIICPKHGSFYQQKYNHLNGYNCPYCNSSKLELYFLESCKELKINFIAQVRIKTINNLPYDFFLQDFNTYIELQGEQHFLNYYNSYFFKSSLKKSIYKNSISHFKYKRMIPDCKKVLEAIKNKNSFISISYLCRNKKTISNILSSLKYILSKNTVVCRFYITEKFYLSLENILLPPDNFKMFDIYQIFILNLKCILDNKIYNPKLIKCIHCRKYFLECFIIKHLTLCEKYTTVRIVISNEN